MFYGNELEFEGNVIVVLNNEDEWDLVIKELIACGQRTKSLEYRTYKTKTCIRLEERGGEIVDSGFDCLEYYEANYSYYRFVSLEELLPYNVPASEFDRLFE